MDVKDSQAEADHQHKTRATTNLPRLALIQAEKTTSAWVMLSHGKCMTQTKN